MEQNQTLAHEQINPLELILILAKHWKSIAAVPLLAATLTAVITLLMPNVYTAKTMILPSEDSSGSMMGAMMAQLGNFAGLAGGVGGGGSKADLYVTMLKSEVLQDPIVDRYKLMSVYEAKYRAKAYSELAEDSSISASKKDGVITISVDSRDPKLAAAIANAYVDELGKLTAKLSMGGAGANRSFLEQRLAKAKVDLAASEEAVKRFQSRNQAVSVTDQAKATLEGVAQLRAQLTLQEVQLATLRQQFSAESREVKTALAGIANLRGQIARLEGRGEGSLPGVGAMPQLGQEYVRLMRDFKVQETLVELLTKQYEMTKLNEAKDTAPFQVLQEARVPELKSGPRRGMLVGLAGAVSLVLTVAFAFIREYLARVGDADRRRLQELRSLLPIQLPGRKR